MKTKLSGHVEDDYNAAITQSTGRYETDPPEGEYSVTRVAAMWRDVVRSTSRLLDILAIVANDSDAEADRAFNMYGAVVKNGED